MGRSSLRCFGTLGVCVPSGCLRHLWDFPPSVTWQAMLLPLPPQLTPIGKYYGL